jgi:hypothetical protein
VGAREGSACISQVRAPRAPFFLKPFQNRRLTVNKAINENKLVHCNRSYCKQSQPLLSFYNGSKNTIHSTL